jgi:hypothetical protein
MAKKLRSVGKKPQMPPEEVTVDASMESQAELIVRQR